MPYQLYRYKKEPIRFRDLDDKKVWTDYGSRKEEAFVRRMSKIKTPFSVAIHPEKKTNPYHPDLLVTSNGKQEIGEIKIKSSPLFYATTHYHVDRQHALTMDLKDSFNYCKLLSDGIDLLIFIWVKWIAHEMETPKETFIVKPMEGIWVTRFSKLRQLECGPTPLPIHWYKESFRQPTTHYIREEPAWYDELLSFEPRLYLGKGRVKNIASKGYADKNGKTFPAGHSSCSYVFNLKHEIFEELFYKLGG